MKMMKYTLPLMAAMTALTACGPKDQAPKVLVLYYSQTATTEALAQEIQSKLGADVEKIVVVDPYDGTFQETVERGMREKGEGVLPELQPLKLDPDDYDIIFLGYPIWFGTYAPPIAALLEQEDFAGKKVVPFCTFGSGGLVSSSNELKANLPDAEVLPGYGVRAARIESMPKEVDIFLKTNGFLEGEFVKLDEFGEAHPVSEEESAIFDEAVAGYDRIRAKAVTVASRALPDGVEYLFTAQDIPGEFAPARTTPMSSKLASGFAPN